jgi:NADPH:quinone reductase-like Zn-dependent oxidoreductase
LRAIWFDRHGGPEVLELRDVPEPKPAQNEVLVDVEAIGVNYRDVYERERDGYGADPPAIIGTEAGGSTADGERLAWAHGSASYAERVAVSRDKTVRIPDDVPTDVAVAALLQGMTARYLAHDSYAITAGDRVLVHAAAGGVGNLLVQMAKLRGAASGEPEPLDVRVLAAKGSLYVQRPTLATYTRTPELLRDRAAKLVALIGSGELRVRIGARYPLAEARRAHEDLEARRTTGKLLLLP